MLVNFVAELRGMRKGQEFTRKNGQKGFNCTVLVEQDARAYEYDADEQVYKDFENKLIEKGQEVAFVADYNPQFQWNKFVVKEGVAL